jgi:outer membrane receptor protein involved in Fe transport
MAAYALTFGMHSLDLHAVLLDVHHEEPRKCLNCRLLKEAILETGTCTFAFRPPPRTQPSGESIYDAYASLAFQSTKGKDVESSQFNFDADALAYIAGHYIHLDHDERVSASGGVSYLWRGTRLSADAIFGTRLRQDLTLPSGFSIPNGAHTPSYATVNLGVSHTFAIGSDGPLTVRVDVVNLFDKLYRIRSGSGVGVFAPQYGARRGIFGGVEWNF